MGHRSAGRGGAGGRADHVHRDRAPEPGNTIYSGKLFATVRGRRYVVAHLANKATDVVRLLAHLVPLAATGEEVDLRALERMVAENARGAVLRAVGIALLVVVPGVRYAISYAHR